MRVIYKHRLSAIGGNTDSIRVRRGAKLLHVAAQRRSGVEIPMLWTEEDDEQPMAWLYIRSIHTGVAIPSECVYVGTVLLENGGHVTHYYHDTSIT